MEAEFRKRIGDCFRENTEKITAVWASLDTEQIWWRPNENCLAPANQLLHLNGNLRQWVLSNLGQVPDERYRDGEFAARAGLDKNALLAEFQNVIRQVLLVLEQPIGAEANLWIQGHETSPVGIWIHVAEHLSYHTGQLLYTAKLLLDKGFAFYDSWALDAVGSPAALALPTIDASPASLPATLQQAFDDYVDLLGRGSFLFAMERYYAEDIVQIENEDEPTIGRAAIMQAEEAAERRIRSADIKVCDAVVDEARGLVWGELDLHFESRRGVEMRLREAFRQRWVDGRIVEQRFYFRGFQDVKLI